MKVSVFPQRQENAGFAAVVARGGGPGCHEKHLPRGTASSEASATAGKYGFRCRCGKERRTEVPRDAPPAGAGQSLDFHNGRKMRDLLPLWQGAEDWGGPGSASRRGRPVPGLPQWQENACFAAVVARAEEQEAEDRRTARSGKPERKQRAKSQSNMERRGIIGYHSSLKISDGRVRETFHTETSAARAFTTNITAATTNVTISADRKLEVSTGQGARELSGNAGILT